MIELERLPHLQHPVMIAAFEGWNDAADSATDAITHLREVWNAEEIASLDPEEYYDFQVNRPNVGFAEDGSRHVTWPTTSFHVARGVGGRDVVLVQGIEPSMKWRSYCEEVLSLCADLGIELVVTLGALLADTPHTRPVPLTSTAEDPSVMSSLGVEPSRYEGPTGIVGVLQEACHRAQLPAASLWAAVPHYVAAPPCPKATLALVHRVEDLLNVSVPLGELPDAARAWEEGVDEMAADDEEVADYVRTLEAQRDTTDLPEASGDAIAREFERYLRRHPDGPTA
jgi:predicted ATP-grasp superfamily ATP-dependent carboligase